MHGNFYGTSIAAVEKVVKNGQVCILDIDVQGVRSCRTGCAACLPPPANLPPPRLNLLPRPSLAHWC